MDGKTNVIPRIMRRAVGKPREAIDAIRAAAAASGRSPLEVANEALRLRLSRGQIGLSEYLAFRLYERDLTFADKAVFGGFRAQKKIEELLVDDYSKILSLDKLSFYALMKGYGIPIPEVLGVFAANRPCALGESLRTPEALAEFLKHGSAPVYMKPAFGGFGRGNVLVKSVERDTATLGDGSSLPLAELCASFVSRGGFGWLLQEELRSHVALAQRCGDRISGVRVHTFLTPEGPVITKAIWKINAGTHDVDNFWAGNLLAQVDVESGTVVRTVDGIGPAQVVDPRHPLTQAALTGFVLPEWQELKRVTMKAATALPGFICPGWDVAITDDGPKILEVNFFGDINLSQHVYRKGFFDDEFMTLLDGRGLRGLFEGPRKPGEECSGTGRKGRLRSHWRW